ncbi:MAG: ATP-binding protein [Methylococcales bacterium]|nr:ATP-binding protein [Methylococcales bacterium]
MNKHFLTDIEIETFKCFDHFKASGFKRVNLIGGKNNIGKTAFMEACYINTHSEDVNTMLTALVNINQSREYVNIIDKSKIESYLLSSTKKCTSSSNTRFIDFEFTDKDAKQQFKFVIDKTEKDINGNDLNASIHLISNIRFINTFGWSDAELAKAYEEIQRNEKENYLSECAKEFDNSIESFKLMGGTKPECKKHGEWRKITEFGDGLKHYISIICALYACKGGYLFIDEIENGIYYGQLDRLWEIILTISKETNCQVFATTHSKEMIDSFARVSEKLEEQDITFTTIIKNREGKLKALTEDYEMLSYSLSQGHEVR